MNYTPAPIPEGCELVTLDNGEGETYQIAVRQVRFAVFLGSWGLALYHCGVHKGDLVKVGPDPHDLALWFKDGSMTAPFMPGYFARGAIPVQAIDHRVVDEDGRVWMRWP